MMNQNEASKYLYLLFGDFMKKQKVSETDKNWLCGQVVFACTIGIITDNESVMMNKSINEKR